jgi:hypothetical protein
MSPESSHFQTRSVPIFATFTGLFYFVPRLMTFVIVTSFAATFTSVLSHRRRYKTFNEWTSGLLFGLLFLDIIVRAMDVNNSIHYDTRKGSRGIIYSGRSGLLADISRILEVVLLAAYLLAVLMVVCASFRTSTASKRKSFHHASIGHANIRTHSGRSEPHYSLHCHPRHSPWFGYRGTRCGLCSARPSRPVLIIPIFFTRGMCFPLYWRPAY